MTAQKKVLITGSTDGIGRRAAYMLAQKGFTILLHGRSAQRLEETRDEILAQLPKAELHLYQADFFDLDQVRKMSELISQEHEIIDVMLNNASVFSNAHELNAQGLERTFVVSHLAHFVLTHQLWPLLQKAINARVINVSSMAQAQQIDFANLQGERSYSGNDAYARAKLCNILFTVELAARLDDDSSITINALHPGVIDTKLLRTGWGMQGSDLDEGALTEVDAADNPRWQKVSGKYFRDLEISVPAAIAKDETVRAQLWSISEQLCDENFSV